MAIAEYSNDKELIFQTYYNSKGSNEYKFAMKNIFLFTNDSDMYITSVKVLDISYEILPIVDGKSVEKIQGCMVKGDIFAMGILKQSESKRINIELFTEKEYHSSIVQNINIKFEVKTLHYSCIQQAVLKSGKIIDHNFQKRERV